MVFLQAEIPAVTVYNRLIYAAPDSEDNRIPGENAKRIP